VLVPTTLRLLETADKTLVLDIGSGTGDFTARLARIAVSVIGIEPSGASLVLASKTCHETKNVRFIHAPLEEAVDMLHGEPATAAVAAMTLMTTPDLMRFAEALSRLLDIGGTFVATLAHPWFWPRYWGYEAEAWFSYPKEIFIEAPFEISRRRTQLITTHIHRPLEHYVSIFASFGFSLDALLEPMPLPDIEVMYPKPWQFPRFVALRWTKYH